jgi:hypothetical protein
LHLLSEHRSTWKVCRAAAVDDSWCHGAHAGKPTAEQLARIRTRKPAPPVIEATLADGSKVPLWNTFGDQQVRYDSRVRQEQFNLGSQEHSWRQFR